MSKETTPENLRSSVPLDKIVMQLFPISGGIQITKCNKCGGVIDRFLCGFGGCNSCDSWTKDYTVEAISLVSTDVA